MTFTLSLSHTHTQALTTTGCDIYDLSFYPHIDHPIDFSALFPSRGLNGVLMSRLNDRSRLGIVITAANLSRRLPSSYDERDSLVLSYFPGDFTLQLFRFYLLSLSFSCWPPPPTLNHAVSLSAFPPFRKPLPFLNPWI